MPETETPQNLWKLELMPFQDKFVFSEAKFPAFVGGWATGKTLCGILRIIHLAEESPNSLCLIVRKEFTDLRDSTMRDFERYTGYKIHETKKEVRLANGSTIMFRHGEDLDSLKNSNLSAFMIEQAEEFETSEQWFFLTGRLRREAKRRSGFVIANTNGHNWIWDLWKNKPPSDDYVLTEASTFDNAQNLPNDFVDTFKAIPERLYRRFVMNDWSFAEGLVWPEFDEARHTCLSYDIPSAWKVGFGLDHGHDHPTAVVFGASDYDGKLIIYNEHYLAGTLISDHARHIKSLEPEYDRLDQIIDHTTRYKTMQTKERAFSILEAYGEEGFHFRPSIADATAGINLVGELFKQNRIIIFKDKCPNLIDEIKNWKWKRPKLGQEKLAQEEAVRLKDDACKALIYLASGRFDATEKPKVKKDGMTVDDYLEQVESQMPIGEFEHVLVGSED